MNLTDLIDLNRVEILEETEDEYKVRYGESEYTIEKSGENEWQGGSAQPTGKGMALSQGLEQRLVPESGIFQDEEVPAAYKEVMMFHEIREQWYVQEKGLETELAHELTLNDEISYVLKFFDKKEAQSYLKFAEKYREERRPAYEEKEGEEESPRTLASIQRERDCIRESFDSRISFAARQGNFEGVAYEERCRDAYLTALDQLAAEIRTRTKEK
ncbi:MAG: hypothetical protein Q7R76_03070 [Candidatus Woesearchaeota archaeon]|nr:hypothetical protein [Candidatus Woesearchaeota archaeon]